MGIRFSRLKAGGMTLAPTGWGSIEMRSPSMSTCAPSASSIDAVMSTSPMRGARSMTLGLSARRAATICLVTAFFEPLMTTSPRNGPLGSTTQVGGAAIAVTVEVAAPVDLASRQDIARWVAKSPAVKGAARGDGAMGNARRAAPFVIVVMTVALAMALAVSAYAAVGQARTHTAFYDRNASVVQDGAVTYLFFARSQQPCDRLAGCNPDQQTYDLWYKASTNGGKDFGPDTLAAKNPGILFGRTIAAAPRNGDGNLYVFWASGGSQ